jgi:hypothetical protein
MPDLLKDDPADWKIREVGDGNLTSSSLLPLARSRGRQDGFVRRCCEEMVRSQPNNILILSKAPNLHWKPLGKSSITSQRSKIVGAALRSCIYPGRRGWVFVYFVVAAATLSQSAILAAPPATEARSSIVGQARAKDTVDDWTV